MPQDIEHLPSQCKILNSKSQYKERERERKDLKIESRLFSKKKEIGREGKRGKKG
jgi:hypothetical protein